MVLNSSYWGLKLEMSVMEAFSVAQAVSGVSCATVFFSASVLGHMSVLRCHLGQGVVMELHLSILN